MFPFSPFNEVQECLTETIDQCFEGYGDLSQYKEYAGIWYEAVQAVIDQEMGKQIDDEI